MANETSGISFAALLFLLFLGLKLANVIAWDWVWVFAPLWIPLLIGLLVVLVMLVAAWIDIKR